MREAFSESLRKYKAADSLLAPLAGIAFTSESDDRSWQHEYYRISNEVQRMTLRALKSGKGMRVNEGWLNAASGYLQVLTKEMRSLAKRVKDLLPSHLAREIGDLEGT
jgi:hypothetical protein